MFPGTLVYVSAGSIGRTAVKQGVDNPVRKAGWLGRVDGESTYVGNAPSCVQFISIFVWFYFGSVRFGSVRFGAVR